MGKGGKNHGTPSPPMGSLGCAWGKKAMGEPHPNPRRRGEIRASECVLNTALVLSLTLPMPPTYEHGRDAQNSVSA